MPATTLSNDMTMTVALRSKALLGESPIWCEREQALYWVDIHAPEIRRFDPATGEDRAWRMPESIGSIGFREKGGFVAALRSGFAFFDPATGALARLHNPIAGTTDLRFNDGRCDRAGRFWAGTVQEKRVPGLAAFYRFDPDRRCTRMADGLTVANGSAFSPDGKVMYFADFVDARDLRLRSGSARGCYFQPPRLHPPGRGRGHPRRRHGRRRRLSVDRAFRRVAGEPICAGRPAPPRHRDAGAAADELRLRRTEPGRALHHVRLLQPRRGDLGEGAALRRHLRARRRDQGPDRAALCRVTP